ncbi:3-hydroxybenzoate 4-monooxygenase [bioreactor metagenome]|uniref:3-hydroxybenzoate 4-monooxygenase n=1 Tax=bioreactor metagenome TaxID=1076179 RepID=A0A645DRE1_9ZZZZ
MALETLPALLLPRKGELGMIDYEKVFSPDLKNAGQDIFELRGIDRQQGALVVVRPDQYVAQVLPLGDHAALSAYFESFMRA